MGNRRQFIAMLPGMLAASRLRAEGSLEELATVEAAMHDFVMQRMLDADGLCRSMLCAETLSPWTKENVSKLDRRRMMDMFQNSPDIAACVNYENALMATSEFALSQIVKHRVTKDAAARELAHRCIRGLLAVIDEGRHYMPGWLPKPFGGVSHARDSHEMSVDQYTKTVIALHAWRPLADAKEQAVIDQFFIDAADFFIARKWRHAYRHRTIVTAATHHHALGLYVPLVLLAAKASGKDLYLAELANFDEPINAALANDGLESGFNGISLIAEGFHLAMKTGSTDERLPRMIEKLWQIGAKCVDDKGVGFIANKDRDPDSQAPRLAAIAPFVDSLNPKLNAPELAKKILGAHRDPAQLRHVRDLSLTIAEVSITSWLVACWRLREAAMQH
ncbi:MAG: hypothetical protein U1F71_18575 [Verrucomicrobiaceae bacterium]